MSSKFKIELSSVGCDLTATRIPDCGVRITATGHPDKLDLLSLCLEHCFPNYRTHIAEGDLRYGHIVLPDSFNIFDLENLSDY